MGSGIQVEALSLNGRINISSVEAGRKVERTGTNTIKPVGLWQEAQGLLE